MRKLTRVPLIISAPNKFEGGRTVDALVQLFDLGPYDHGNGRELKLMKPLKRFLSKSRPLWLCI